MKKSLFYATFEYYILCLLVQMLFGLKANLQGEKSLNSEQRLVLIGPNPLHLNIHSPVRHESETSLRKVPTGPNPLHEHRIGSLFSTEIETP